MRIAFVYDAIYPYILGGVERRVWELAKRLTDRGHDVHIYGMKLWPGERMLTTNGVHLHGVCRPKKLYQNGKRTLSQAITFGGSVFIPLARNHFDVVDCQQFPYISGLSAVAACKLSRSTLVITWHEIWGDYWYEYLGRTGASGKFLERVLALSSDQNVVVSEMTWKGLSKLTNAPKQIEIIPNGIDIPLINAVNPSDSTTDLLFVGRLIREKHVDTLLDSVHLLKENLPSIHCTIIGDGPERTKLESKTRSLGIEANVLYTGFLKDSNEVIARMKSAKIFVLPSTREGFGISALEAMACGTPLITIDHPQNASRMFIQAGCGALSRLDPAELAEKISDMLNHENEQRETCISHSHKYDWEIITDMIEDYYRQICPG